MSEILRPHWIIGSFTLEQAGREAYMRGYTLKVSWHKSIGLRVIAVPMVKENGK